MPTTRSPYAHRRRVFANHLVQLSGGLLMPTLVYPGDLLGIQVLGARGGNSRPYLGENTVDLI